MTTLNTTCPSPEVLEDALLTLEQISTRITALALNACRNPEHSVRLRALLSDLLEAIQECEGDLGTYPRMSVDGPWRSDTDSRLTLQILQHCF